VITGTGSVMNIGVQGMLKSHANIKQNADDIVRAGTVGVNENGEGGDFIGDITTSIVDMNVNQHIFDASAKIVKTADEMLGTVLDIKS